MNLKNLIRNKINDKYLDKAAVRSDAAAELDRLTRWTLLLLIILLGLVRWSNVVDPKYLEKRKNKGQKSSFAFPDPSHFGLSIPDSDPSSKKISQFRKINQNHKNNIT